MAAVTNRISLQLTDAELQAIRSAVGVLQTQLLPHLVDLDSEARRELPKMGDKTVAFVRKAYEYAGSNPALCPPFLDLPEFGVDLNAVDTLLSLLRPLTQVTDMLDDSALLAGSEAYAAALSYYQAVKGAARSGVPGAQSIAEDLSQRFPGRPSNATTPAPATAKA